MPKKKGRNGGGGGAVASRKVGNKEIASDDESIFTDNASIISNVSDDSYMRDDGVAGATIGEEDSDELTQDEIFEEKLRDAIELSSQKSAAGRVNSINAICSAFSKKFVPEFVENRRMTLIDIVERSLKKGKASEQVAAAGLAVALCIQLRGVADELYRDVKPILAVIMNDKSSAGAARVGCAYALGNICFLAAQAILEVQSVMEMLENIFRNCKEGSPDLAPLATAALASWTLLSTVMPYSSVQNLLVKLCPVFSRLLDSPDVDLRIATGEAIAVLYEFVAEDLDETDTEEGEMSSAAEDEEVETRNGGSSEELSGVEKAVAELVPKLQSLSTDSHKYRSKKDRKEQKSSFRDILRTVDEGDDYYESVNINTREKLEIESWAQKKQYQAICKALASGTNMHLTENDLIRGVFNMGAPIPSLSTMKSHKPSKSERQFANQQAFKIRSQARGKHRDKRSAVI